ncbi:MAG: hypothetical protein JST01_29000 [Cyanobacteria bacterium SZAS TMP-1]|nr:hypothetical protein [Cyanobacteria bacterium SZAS TMP-1]
MAQVQVNRRPRGNMLFLCIAMFALLIAIVGLGFGVYFLFFQQKRLQTRCEDLALKAAQQLNLNDYAGKLNNLQARSRELVYNSRQLSNATEDDNYKEFAPLAAQVMNQSRDGAILVDDERKKYVSTSLSKLRQLIKNAAPADGKSLTVANVSADAAEVMDFKLGYLAGSKSTSNVEVLEGPPDLFEWDLSKNYIQRGKGVNLYRAAVNLKLPGPDDDLNFELAPLAAPVKGTVAPLRLTSGEGFQNTLTLRENYKDLPGTCKWSPSAVQITMTAKVRETTAAKLEGSTRAASTACTNGAGGEIK